MTKIERSHVAPARLQIARATGEHLRTARADLSPREWRALRRRLLLTERRAVRLIDTFDAAPFFVVGGQVIR